jgi:hypothetical protein
METTQKKTQAQKNLETIAAAGIIKSSDWTTGSGRFVSKRAIPAGAIEISRNRIPENRQDVADFFAANPRVKKIITVV